jgi:hypothetical protein
MRNNCKGEEHNELPAYPLGGRHLTRAVLWSYTASRHVTLATIGTSDIWEQLAYPRAAASATTANSESSSVSTGPQFGWQLHVKIASLVQQIMTELTGAEWEGDKIMVKVKLSLCLTTEVLRHEDVQRSGCIDPHFLDLGTSWRWVVSLAPLPLYPRERAPVPIL